MQKVITINLLDIIKIVLSKKDSYSNKGGLKYFIGYDDYNVSIITLCAILPKMNAEVKYFDKKYDEDLFKKYNRILHKLQVYSTTNLIVNQCIMIIQN